MTHRLGGADSHRDIARTIEHVCRSAAPGEDQSRPFDPDHWAALAATGVFAAGVDAASTAADLVAVTEVLGAEAVAGPVIATILVLSAVADHPTIDGRLVRAYQEGARVVTVADGDDVVPWGAVANDIWLLDPSAATVGPARWVSPAEEASVLGLDRWAVGAVCAAGDAVDAGPALLAADLASAAYAIGGAGRAMSIATDFVSTRVQFGAPLISFQTISHRLAAADAELEAAAALTVMAASVRGPDGRPLAAAARRRAVQASVSIAMTAHQLLGAMGFVDHTLLAAISRRVQQLAHLPGGGATNTAALRPLTLSR